MFLDISGDVGVLRSTTAHEDLVDLLAWGVAAVVVYDGLGGEAWDGCDDVILTHAESFTLLDQLVGKRVAEGLAAGAFGGFVGELLVLEELVYQGLVDRPTFTHSTGFIVFLDTIGEVADYGIDENVTRSGIEVIAGVDAALVVGWNEVDVSYAADVRASTEFGGVVEEEGVKEGNERGALPAGGLIAYAEVCGGGDASLGG